MLDQEKFQKILNYSLKLLGIKLYTKKELSIKLNNKFEEEKEKIEEVLDNLERTGLINDKVYAEQYIKMRCNNSPRGKFLLTQELNKKGIKKDLITELTSDIDENLLATQAGVKKYNTIDKKLEKQKQKEKLFRFLASRGFKVSVIINTVNKIID